MASSSIEADALTRAGFTVRPRSASELSLSRGGELLIAHLIRQQTSPTRTQLERTRDLPAGEVALFVAPRATNKARQLVAQEPHAWLITHDGAVVFENEATTAAPRRAAARGRTPWGRYALIRTLMRDPQPRTQLQLAAEVGLTQGAVSGALAKLGSLVRSGPAGWVAADPRVLWEVFLTEYPGAQGARTHWYSRLPFVEQCDALRSHALLSADAGADTIAPWRHPVRAIAYTADPLDMDALGFSPATDAEATVDLIMPADRTVFATATAWGFGVADPLIAAWDLRDIGGNDVDEATARLKQRVLERFDS